MAKIFVAVGTQLPFDRLVKTIDEWAGRERRHDIFAQIANSTFAPGNIAYAHFISPREFRERTEEAEIVIGHAGMGTIITALELGKPILVMPRHAKFGEQRNDHQLASARAFLAHGRINVAWNETQLASQLAQVDDFLMANSSLGREAHPALIQTISDFLNGSLEPLSLNSVDGRKSPRVSGALRSVRHAL